MTQLRCGPKRVRTPQHGHGRFPAKVQDRIARTSFVINGNAYDERKLALPGEWARNCGRIQSVWSCLVFHLKKNG